MRNRKIHNGEKSVKPLPQSSLVTSQYLNLPDLQFFYWCNRQFGINRGVYNTIEQWFYEKGIVNIQIRRIHLLSFMEFVKAQRPKNGDKDEHTFLRFGHGGLTKSLNEFMGDNGQSSKVIPLRKH